eukprot:scaffold111_cov252-Pinguiococcus_pyrenoidosus.AAC.22
MARDQQFQLVATVGRVVAARLLDALQNPPHAARAIGQRARDAGDAIGARSPRPIFHPELGVGRRLELLDVTASSAQDTPDHSVGVGHEKQHGDHGRRAACICDATADRQRRRQVAENATGRRCT